MLILREDPCPMSLREENYLISREENWQFSVGGELIGFKVAVLVKISFTL